MSETTPEAPGTDQPTEDTSPGISELPAPTGSGRFAVFSPELGNYVSGVMSKADASRAAKAMRADRDAVTYGHKLTTVEV